MKNAPKGNKLALSQFSDTKMHRTSLVLTDRMQLANKSPNYNDQGNYLQKEQSRRINRSLENNSKRLKLRNFMSPNNISAGKRAFPPFKKMLNRHVSFYYLF